MAYHNPNTHDLKKASDAELKRWLGPVARYVDTHDTDTVFAMRQCYRTYQFPKVTQEQREMFERYLKRAAKNKHTRADTIRVFNAYRKLRRMPQNKIPEAQRKYY